MQHASRHVLISYFSMENTKEMHCREFSEHRTLQNSRRAVATVRVNIIFVMSILCASSSCVNSVAGLEADIRYIHRVYEIIPKQLRDKKAKHWNINDNENQ